MIHRTRHFLKRLFRDCRGQDFVEYSLLLGFVAVASAATIPPLAEPIGEIFSKTQSIATRAAGSRPSPTSPDTKWPVRDDLQLSTLPRSIFLFRAQNAIL
jgi:Flp pilus assembly pilin Flp